MPDVMKIDRVKKTSTERQKVNRIEQVGFTGAIIAQKAVQLRAELDFSLFDVFEIENGQRL
jgi:hypothetical protein